VLVALSADVCATSENEQAPELFDVKVSKPFKAQELQKIILKSI